MTHRAAASDSAGSWREVEIELQAIHDHANPYTGVEVWAEFSHDSGTAIRRQAFWDGGRTWRIRFAPTCPGRWRWRVGSATGDPGFDGCDGVVDCGDDRSTRHRFYRHGFWRMATDRRTLTHADGTAALMVADTAWALPWRATEEQCRHYARDRKAKGFNAVLLMTVQPDMDARGPRDRTADGGFDVAFEDLPKGRLEVLRPEYFRALDRLLDILVEHEIVPVLQPVFQGYGWKGLRTAGPVVAPTAYARYCRYLVARYGARPAIYLVGADGTGYEPQVAAGGEEVERVDAYGQPTGVHYRPDADNRAHQEAPWLDFQWCQTGHGGEHVPERVAFMWANEPVKGIANGEPTYERMQEPWRAAGWWQGHEAWSNLCAGGTMGVVYGAASLWQWRLHANEPGHAAWCHAAEAGWREALDFEGSSHVGRIAHIVEGLPLTGMVPDWQGTVGRRGLLVPGTLLIAYTGDGGPLRIRSDEVPRRYRVVDPRTGRVVRTGVRGGDDPIPDEGGAPRVYICTA